MKHERLWTLGNNLRLFGDWARPVIKEGTYCMEPWVLAANKESWNPPSKTNDVVYGD